MPGESITRNYWLMPEGGGDLQSMKLTSGTMQPPGYGEVCVRVEAIGLNFADVFTGFGLYSPISSGEIKGDIIPGLEFSGVIEQVGNKSAKRMDDSLNGKDQIERGGQLVVLDEDVWAIAETQSQTYSVGDKVYGCMRFGAYATHVNVPAHQIRKLPGSWNFSDSASFTAQTLTSYFALKELGNVKKNQIVLIHSMAGGCGLQALKICEKLGAIPIGTVGRREKVDILRSQFPFLSSEQIIVRSTAQEFSQQLETSLQFVKNKFGLKEDRINITLDAILGDWFHPAHSKMAPGGRYVIFGAASMTPNSDRLGFLEWIKLAWKWIWRPKLDLLEMPSKNVSIMSFNLIHCLNDAGTLLALLEEIEALDLAPPLVGSEFAFEDLVHALSFLRSGQSVGKVVIAPVAPPREPRSFVKTN